MSTEVILQEPQIHDPKSKENKCPKCGFDAPEGIPICWKCGEHLKK